MLQESIEHPMNEVPRSQSRDPYERIFAEWSDVVTLFSRCALTISSDKLMALSGLAKEMRRRIEEMRPRTRHRYVAGFWEEELPGVLPWCMLEPASRAAPYRAPTWSWASLDGPIRHPRNTIISFSSLIALEVQQPPGEAETGQVQYASITLLGPVLRVMVSTVDRWERPNSATFSIASLFGASYSSSLTRKGNVGKAPEQFGIVHPKVKFDTLEDIREDIFQIIIQADDFGIEGMAIVAMDVETSTFRRVGYFRYRFGGPNLDWGEGSRAGRARSILFVDESGAAQDFVAKIPKRRIVLV